MSDRFQSELTRRASFFPFADRFVYLAGFMDPEFDGKKRTETQLDVLETFGDLIRKGTKTKLLCNGDLSAEEADKLIQEEKIDAAVFGRPWISNPE